MIYEIERGKTVGIFGQPGTGKTYLTRQIIDALEKDVVVFDTIGAIHPKNVTIYEVDKKDIDKQAILFAEIVKRTHRNVGVNLKRLIKDEIVDFTQALLLVSDLKNRYIFFDEMADYTPQMGKSTPELERLVRHGRNEGDTFFFNTQRPAYLTKNVVSLVTVAVFFRLVWERDIKVVKEILNNLGHTHITKEIIEITNQGVGDCKIYQFGTGANKGKMKEVYDAKERI